MIKSREFGKTKDGNLVTAFELRNHRDVSVTILDFGCTVHSFIVKDKNGNKRDIVLGYNDVISYEQGTCYLGAVVGRYANRIGGAKFILDDKEYILEKAKGENNHVHGVFSKKMFKARIDNDKLILEYLSPSMEEGFPGNLHVKVTYSLNDDNELEINYLAYSDAPTIINLTNHTYFNLNGQDGSTILDHKVRLNCSYFSEYNDDFSQTGRIISVDNTPLDFRKEHSLIERFYDNYYQLRLCTGYDHNMIIDDQENKLKFVGSCKSDNSGLLLEIYTTEPAIHFYSSNYLQFDEANVGKNDIRYPKQGGICFEAQHYPDSPSHPHFPSTVLRPGDKYQQKTIYKIKAF